MVTVTVAAAVHFTLALIAIVFLVVLVILGAIAVTVQVFVVPLLRRIETD